MINKKKIGNVLNFTLSSKDTSTIMVLKSAFFCKQIRVDLITVVPCSIGEHYHFYESGTI